MCTVSFVPTATGFRLAMNRDEKRSRVAALPPAAFKISKRRVLYPREPSGGTWLAVNDAGLCLALINWHRIERQPVGRIESRGEIIPALMGEKDSNSIARRLRRMPLRKKRPFRLIVSDPQNQRLIEWQWDAKSLKTQRYRWERHHWYSSGYDERAAEESRAAVCEKYSLDTLATMRKLHASHLPKRGPFSICMHRPDAATVSYSEVSVMGRRIAMSYQAGAPCKERRRVTRRL